MSHLVQQRGVETNGAGDVRRGAALALQLRQHALQRVMLGLDGGLAHGEEERQVLGPLALCHAQAQHRARPEEQRRTTLQTPPTKRLRVRVQRHRHATTQQRVDELRFAEYALHTR